MFKVTKLNVAICNAAREQGAGQRTVIKLIKSGRVNWQDEATVENMRQAYFIGRLAGELDLESNDAAALVFDKRPYNKLAKNPGADTYRTPEEQRIFRNTVSAWSYIRECAGAPSAQTGGKRGKKEEKKGQDAPPKVGAVIASIRKPENYQDAYTFALAVRDVLDKYIAVNAEHVKLGEIGTLFREYIAGCAKLPKNYDAQAALKADLKAKHATKRAKVEKPVPPALPAPVMHLESNTAQ